MGRIRALTFRCPAAKQNAGGEAELDFAARFSFDDWEAPVPNISAVC